MSGLSLCGCGTSTEMSKEEQANFKGGPPPPDWGIEAEKRKAAAEKRAPASFKAWQEQRKASVANQGAAPPDSATH